MTKSSQVRVESSLQFSREILGPHPTSLRSAALSQGERGYFHLVTCQVFLPRLRRATELCRS